MKLEPHVNGIPKLKQIVTTPIYNGLKIYDVFLTNVPNYFRIPQICQPICPDNDQAGAPTDHSVVWIQPIENLSCQTREYKSISYRPMPDSSIQLFGQWIINHDWENIENGTESCIQAENLQQTLNFHLEKFFPMKTFRKSLSDKPWITKEIKQLDRKIKRTYRKHGKNLKYSVLMQEYQTKINKSVENYVEKYVQQLKTCQPGRAYAVLKKLSCAPGDYKDDGSFVLWSHIDNNLSIPQSTEGIASHFAKISSEYPPLDESS